MKLGFKDLNIINEVITRKNFSSFLWDYDFFSKPYAIVRFGIQKEISDIAGMGNDYCQWI